MDNRKFDQLLAAVTELGKKIPTFESLRPAYVTIKTTSGYDFHYFFTLLAELSQTLNAATLSPEIWDEVMEISLDGLVSRILGLASVADSMSRSSNESDRSQILNQGYTQIGSIKEWLIANNILLKLKIPDLDSIASKVQLLNAALNDLPEKRRQLEDLLGGATLKEMTNGFGSRKKEIHGQRKFAFWGLMVTFLVATAAVAGLFFFWPLPAADAQLGPWIEYAALRIVTLFPIYLAVRFFWSEHSRERQLEEDYGFREAVSGSLTVLAGTISDDKAKHEVIGNTLDRVFNPIDKHKNEAIGAENILKEVRKTIKAFNGVGKT